MSNNVMKQKLNRKNRLGLGIRSHLAWGFTIFVIIVLVIVWVFQVLLLDYFYERTKISELREVQIGIDRGIQSGELDEMCGDLASKYNVCIIVYSVENGDLSEAVISKEVSPACVIHYAEKKYLSTLYNQAIAAGGVFTESYNLNPRDFDRDDIKKPNNGGIDGKEHSDGGHHQDKELIIAASVKVFEDNLGNEYAAFINLQFSPVNSIQHTRNTQFAYIAAVVIASAVIFSLIFSSRIARPLEKMTVSAERMASGDYSAEFAVEGYRETKRLASTLNYAVGEISKTDELQRELIANVSHDLRTPLTLISGYAEMMRDIPGENNKENSQLIVDESKRLTELVNDILDFSKYSSGVEQPIIMKFNLTDSITKAMERYNELIKFHGYTIDLKAETSVFVYADERMILQVLYNLINNAINYTGEDKTVKITQEILLNNTVKISISDSGNGIPKDDIENIWNRYYRVDKNHSRPVAGSGLGLSIVSKLLQIHSASYGVETSRSKGTTFWFSIKIAD